MVMEKTGLASEEAKALLLEFGNVRQAIQAFQARK
jgi:hypothetical protein